MTKQIIACFSLAVVLGIGTLIPSPAQAQIEEIPCTFTRDDVLNALANGATEDEVFAQFSGCTAVEDDVTTQSLNGNLESVGAAVAQVFPTGITFWEAIQSCGYHPQREELECSIGIFQNFGFGGFPNVAPGTHEWVLFCVDFGGGFVPIHTSALHIHDNPFFGVPTQQPPWCQGAAVQANPALHGIANVGLTLRGLAILSWVFNPSLAPVPCAFAPPFGNTAFFQFKLDP